MRKTIFHTFIWLLLFIVLVFEIIYLFFRTDEFFDFSQYQFLLSTSICCAFVITLVFAITGAVNMLRQSKIRKMNFLSVFKLIFLPGFLAGIIGLTFIFGFYYFFDQESIEIFKNQYLDLSIERAKGGEQYEQIKEVINSKKVRETSFLTWRTYTLGLFFITFFNLSLALMLSLMWKIRNTK